MQLVYFRSGVDCGNGDLSQKPKFASHNDGFGVSVQTWCRDRCVFLLAYLPNDRKAHRRSSLHSKFSVCHLRDGIFLLTVINCERLEGYAVSSALQRSSNNQYCLSAAAVDIALFLVLQ